MSDSDKWQLLFPCSALFSFPPLGGYENSCFVLKFRRLWRLFVKINGGSPIVS